MAGLSGLAAGGFAASASSSATSGPATGGPQGLNISGINTGYSLGAQGTGGGSSTGSVPSYVWVAGLAIFALIALKMVRG